MNAPKNVMIFITIGAFTSACSERILSQYYNDFISCLCAMICLAFYCELTARLIKEPVTVILMPSTIPLLPGSSIYYTMLYAIKGDMQMFLSYGKATLYAGLGIGLGAIISSTAVKVINSYRNKID